MKMSLLGMGCLVSAAILLASDVGVNAQVVVRNINATTEGSRNTFGPFNSAAMTYQITINASELGAVDVGNQITGIAFRLDNTTGSQPTGPATDLTFSNYDVYMGVLDPQWTPNFNSPTLASNYAPNAGGRTQVRSGGYTLPANSLTGGSIPNAFGSYINFNLNGGGYAYQGGNLIIEIRHTGNGVSSPNLDANPNDPQSGARATFGDYTATEGLITQNAVVRLRVVPAPNSLLIALIGLAPLGCCILRRRPHNR